VSGIRIVCRISRRRKTGSRSHTLRSNEASVRRYSNG
jgi:hypothetical protein